MDLLSAPDYWATRWLFERALAAIYLIAFLNAVNQGTALLGSRGLSPIPAFLRSTTFRETPTIFHWRYSDRIFKSAAWAGTILSGMMLAGLLSRGPIFIHMVSWLAIWATYLSIVNVGQRFYSFGWESMTLEAGFFASFLGPAHVEPSIIPIILLRWMLFRVEFGAGLIKLKNDACWRDRTCLYYHYETQPLPNPLSWYFHRLPKGVHRFSVGFSHFVQVLIPFGLFFPQPIAAIAGGFIILHQLLLIVSGNYSWLNWLTVVLAIPAFSGAQLGVFLPTATVAARHPLFELMLLGLAAFTVVLSIKPAKNFFSSNQLMNYSFNPYHIVNVYGAFGSVTRERFEIVLEGTLDGNANEASEWREYEFKAKPGDPRRRPPQVAPYHLRIDWLMWFLPMSVAVTPAGIIVPGYQRWFIRFISKLLEGDRETALLLKHAPFEEGPPAAVRARFYRYRYTNPGMRKATGEWWSRSLVGEYLQPVTLEDVGRGKEEQD